MENIAYSKVIDAIIRNVGLDDFLENSLNKILQIEESSIQKKLDIIEKELHEYETKYNLSSDEFYKRFNNGELDDRTDYIDWYSLVDSREKLLSTLILVRQ